MANHKRTRSKRVVRCTLCTPWRWLGNGKQRVNSNTRRKLLASQQDMRDVVD